MALQLQLSHRTDLHPDQSLAMSELKHTKTGRIPLRAVLQECTPLMRLAVPLVLAMVGQLAITTTDMLMLGRLGPEALAAVALALSIFHPLMLLGFGIGMAVTPLAAEALSQNRSRQVRRIVRQGIWAAVPFALLSAPILVFSNPIFVALGQDPDLSKSAQDYLRGIYAGFFFTLMFNVLRAYQTAHERTRAVMVITLAAIPLNAGFNYVLIFGVGSWSGLGVMGAGIGSSLTNAVMGITLAWYCARAKPFRRYAIFNRFWRPDWWAFWRIHRIGVPIGLMIVLEVSVFAGSAQLMGRIGTLELAAHQISLQLASLFFMVPLGIGQAATARVGIVLGQEGVDRAAAVGWATLLLASATMFVSASCFVLMPQLLVWPFLDGGKESQQVLALAVTYLAVAAAFQLFDGLQVAAAHVLRGFQDTSVPMWIAAVGFWGIAMPSAFWLGLRTPLEGVGVWLGLAFGLAFCSAALIWRIVRLVRTSRTGI